MRHFILSGLIVGAAACSADSAHDPSSSVISVRLVDDRGATAGRHQVIVTPPSANRLDAQTRHDGTAEIRVSDVGTYVVKIIPRDGFVAGLDPLSKNVNVVSNGATTVEFTLQRSGLPASEIRPGG